MKKGILPSILTSVLLIGIVLSGCKKENSLGIDNDRVIKTPYSLFAADSSGAIITTTDGTHYASVFPPDGYSANLLLLSGKNLMMVKDNLHLSTNSGRDFNPVYKQVNKFPWQSMAYDFPEQGRVYISSTAERGIAYSEDNGLTWATDTFWKKDSLPVSFEISSFAGLGDGQAFAYSNEGNVLFVRRNLEEGWVPVIIQGNFPTINSEYYLTSNDSTLFLVDHNGTGGAWYSGDKGVHWTKYNRGELPINTKYFCAISPSADGNSLLIGTDSLGIFLAQDGTFRAASGGLLKGTTVWSFAKKSNYYKNNAVKQYIYAGTRNGLYRSENDGVTWYQITAGVWNRKYVAIQ